MDRKKVCVYCSSREGLGGEIEEGAQEIGRAIARCGAEMVYGGVNAGLMHVVASAAKEAGAKVIGVVPEVFAHRADPLCDDIIMARDLNDRKARMMDMSDLFVVLPGGLGTIDEWISTLSWILVQEKVNPDADKPILVWNYESMYRHQLLQLKATSDSVFARGKGVDRSRAYDELPSLLDALAALLK